MKIKVLNKENILNIIDEIQKDLDTPVQNKAVISKELINNKTTRNTLDNLWVEYIEKSNVLKVNIT